MGDGRNKKVKILEFRGSFLLRGTKASRILVRKGGRKMRKGKTKSKPKTETDDDDVDKDEYDGGERR